ncbi:P-loop containing nucleoside triphosphate hydrolase protein [Gorgonomyces haynaldii]|nr:P-loop containing nucleoside triphosphate hydrolase protein [Gorgonomyces haynaldii]
MEQVRVCLRIRPPMVDEQKPPKICLQIVDGQSQVVIGRDLKRSFTFDHVFGHTTNQEQIYELVGAPLVSQFVEGFNATILAYGQTFSGKTYTMGSQNTMETSDEASGIIPRVIQDLFFRIEADDKYDYRIKLCFLEVYQEQVRDLLSDTNKEISIRETRDGIIVVSGADEHLVESYDSMMQLLAKGAHERSTGDTQMHQHSSRSHALFTIVLERLHKGTDQILRRSKLHLVDLAGSERVKRTGAEGIRLRESVKINSGLLALGNVISVLGQERVKTPDVYVPYRDSKLTRLLQDSLGGNSRTVMIACVSPLEEDLDETLNTLKYANRARQIQNKPILNILDSKIVEMHSMQEKISELQDKLESMSQVQVTPEMIDFDNEQWMQYFMDQLKTRTIRGTNAIKLLEETKQEKESLEQQLNQLQSQLEHQSLLEQQFLQLQQESRQLQEQNKLLETQLLESQKPVEEVKDEQDYETLESELKTVVQEKQFLTSDIEVLCDGILKLLNKEQIQKDKILQIVSKYRSVQHIRTPSDARAKRRSIRQRSEQDDGNSKSLEVELRETRRYLSQIEEELSSTKTMLRQNEAIAQESAFEVSRLQRSLSKVLQGQKATQEDLRFMNDKSVQTLESEQDFPVHSAEHENNERLNQELQQTLKAKVDLLKELSKSNKENERLRHSFGDQIQKLERELESNKREMDRLHGEIEDKEHQKEKLKEEHERKIKTMESHLQKAKQKLKETEKSSKDKSFSEKKHQDNLHEIERLQQNLSHLKKKLKDDQEKLNELEQRRTKEINHSNKQLEEETRKCRQLEAKLEILTKKLDRKIEKREKSQGCQTENFVADAALRLTKVEDRLAQLHQQMDETEAKLSDPEALDQEQIQRLNREKSVLVLHVAELVTEKHQLLSILETGNQTDVDYQSLIEKYIDDKELLDLIPRIKACNLSETKHLFVQLLDRVHELKILSDPLQDQELVEARQELESLLRDKEAALGDSLREQKALESLLHQREQESHQLQEQLQEAERVQQELKQTEKQKQEQLRKQLQEAERLKDQLQHKIYETEEAFEKKEQELRDRARQLKERDDLMQEKISASISKPRTDIFVQTEPDQTKQTIQKLEKDVYYYRSANRELKVKLREIVAVNHKLAKKPMEIVAAAVE